MLIKDICQSNCFRWCWPWLCHALIVIWLLSLPNPAFSHPFHRQEYPAHQTPSQCLAPETQTPTTINYYLLLAWLISCLANHSSIILPLLTHAPTTTKEIFSKPNSISCLKPSVVFSCSEYKTQNFKHKLEVLALNQPLTTSHLHQVLPLSF